MNNLNLLKPRMKIISKSVKTVIGWVKNTMRVFQHPSKPKEEIMLNLTWIPKCYPCKKKPLKWEFFHAALCANLECPRSQVKPATPFYCDWCWNKKEFYNQCWGCKSPKLKTGTILGLSD